MVSWCTIVPLCVRKFTVISWTITDVHGEGTGNFAQERRKKRKPNKSQRFLQDSEWDLIRIFRFPESCHPLGLPVTVSINHSQCMFSSRGNKIKFYPIWGRMGLEIEVQHEHSLDVPLHCQTLSKSYNHLKTSDRLKSMHKLWLLGKSKLTFSIALLFTILFPKWHGQETARQDWMQYKHSHASKGPQATQGCSSPFGCRLHKAQAQSIHWSLQHQTQSAHHANYSSWKFNQITGIQNNKGKTHQHEHNAHIAVPSQARGLNHASI